MRHIPDVKYAYKPCSYVGTGCAYEALTGNDFDFSEPDGLKTDGYLSLDYENKYLRHYLKVTKKRYFKRSERIKLKDFLMSNRKKCCICVLGHFLFAVGHDYWSFFDNDNDDVVCVWYLSEDQAVHKSD